MKDIQFSKLLKRYQKASPQGKRRKDFFRAFEEKMLYRTTKTENPETTLAMIRKALRKR